MKKTYISCSKSQSAFDNKKPHPTFCTLAFSLAIIGFASQTIAANYTMTDLNTVLLSGGVRNIQPYAINNSGKVVGNGQPVGVASYYTWVYDSANGSIADITRTSNGGILTIPSDINNLGQSIGVGSPDGISIYRSFLRNSNGVGTDLGALTGDYDSRAWAINDSGNVVGISFSSLTRVWQSSRAYLWTVTGGMQPLGSLAGPNDWSRAYGINTSGQAVGVSYYVGSCYTSAGHAFVSTSTGLKDLHSSTMPIDPRLGCGSSVAAKINDSGTAVGAHANSWGIDSPSGPAQVLHATVWNTATGAFTDLSSGINAKTSQALNAINASGQVVGAEVTYSGVLINNLYEGTVTGSDHALVGDINGGGLFDLNQVFTNKPANWTFQSAFDINDAGQILVSAKDAAGVSHVVLLTPQSTSVSIPVTPSTLVATAASSSQVNVSWTVNATNVTTQSLERCAGVSCSNFAQIASLGAGVTSYSDTPLTPSTSYSYRVLTSDATGNSAYSNTATVITPAPAPLTNVAPNAPSNLANIALTANQVVLTWADNATNELNYLIERCRGASCTSFSQVATVGANITTYSNSGLRRNTNYSYRVTASNATGKSAYSNTLSVKTLP